MKYVVLNFMEQWQKWRKRDAEFPVWSGDGDDFHISVDKPFFPADALTRQV